jgi:hypothetical protein
MYKRVGMTFLQKSEYGPKEKYIFDSTVNQVDKHFPNDRNLVINTTWFGPQFSNGEWEKANSFDQDFDNLFLLSVIDPLYLQNKDLDLLIKKYNIKNVYRIGMFENSIYEWNFHALIGKDVMPLYTEEQVKMTKNPEYIYMLYQRKPRDHRIEITEILRHRNLLKHGIVTLGGPEPGEIWQGHHKNWEVLTIDDYSEKYIGAGFGNKKYGGVPDDLVTVGRLDLWKNHFLNVISETVFNEWEPLLVTEKMWKPMIGLRPYVVHGNPKTYSWLNKNGFKTFNNYWKHVDAENLGAHDTVYRVIEFLQTQDLYSMYVDMLSDLRYNKERFYEFSKEQEYKMENIFENY